MQKSRNRSTAVVLGALLAAATQGCTTAFPDRIVGVGTEPFWDFDLNGDKLTYSNFNRPDKLAATVSRQESAEQLRVSGELGGSPLEITVKREKCSDGMSDGTYPYDVILIVLGERLLGCASPFGRD